MGFFRKEDSHEFKPLLVEIEEEPRNPLGGMIFWILMAALVFAGGWMFLGKVDVVISAKGKIIPVGEVKVLQPLTTGVISSILVKEGDYVKEGQVLMEIDPSGTEPELESMKTNYKQLSLEIERLRALLDGKPFQPDISRYDRNIILVQKEIYLSTLERLNNQIGIKKEELRQIEEQLASTEKVKEQNLFLLNKNTEKMSRLRTIQDIISKDEVDAVERECMTNKNDIKIAEHRSRELSAGKMRIKKEMEFLQEDERNRLLAELAEKRKNHLYLRASIDKTAYLNSKQQITAPVSGHINKILIHTVGGVVTPAEKVISLVPDASPLIIKALVQNKDIGFVTSGMTAAIKVDTFNFQKYGILDGTVKHVGKDSLEDKMLGLVYETYVTLNNTTLMIEGVETPIATGMSVTVEIKVGKRRIIEFFVYPLIKYLDEGISVR